MKTRFEFFKQQSAWRSTRFGRAAYIGLSVAASVLLVAAVLLSALLFHTMFNLSIQLFPPMELKGGDARGFYILTALYVLVAAVVVLVWGVHTLRRGQHPAAATV